MQTFAPALAVVAALLWPAVTSAQSLGEVAQREAARRAAATSSKAPAGAAQPPAATQVPVDQGGAATAQEPSGGSVSLAEVARREAARRKALAASGQRAKALTTRDVKKWEPPQEASTADSSAGADDGKKADDSGAASSEKSRATDAQTAPAEQAKGEEYWHGRITSAREELRRNEAFAEALQSRINALSAEFSAKDDPYQRAQIADGRQKALAELDRLTTDIDTNKKSIADIEDAARKAGVPAGWIR
jgi:hypothetical protein